MQAAAEAPKTFYWAGPGGEVFASPEYLSEIVPQYPERWSVAPIPFAIDLNPTLEAQFEGTKRDPLVDNVIARLTARLQESDLGNRLVGLPKEKTDSKTAGESDKDPKDLPRMIIRPGTGDPDVLLSPLDFIKWREFNPLLLFVNAVDKLPDAADFDLGRTRLVRGAAHNGVWFEADKTSRRINKAMWESTQGNNTVISPIEGQDEKDVLDNVAMRIMVHFGEQFITVRGDASSELPIVTWSDWVNDGLHREMWDMTRELHAAGLLEDHAVLKGFTPELPAHEKFIMRAIGRSALGEGMYSRFKRHLKVLAVSPSGGGKVDWENNPNVKPHFIPVAYLTPTGYMVYTPDGAPEGTKFVNGSVETAENLDAMIMRQAFATGLVHNLEEYQVWRDRQLSENGMIPVYLPQADKFDEDYVMVHIHADPTEADTEAVEVVEPDYQLFPPVDMACGGKGGKGSLLSALAKSRWFTQPGQEGVHPLEDKAVAVRLRGHGMVLISKDAKTATDIIINKMKAVRPPPGI